MARLCHSRGQEPRSAQCARPSRADGDTAHSRLVRPVPARRARTGRGRGSADARAAGATRRQARLVVGRGFFLTHCGNAAATARASNRSRTPKFQLRDPRKGAAPPEATGNKTKERKSSDHAWRAHEADLTTKKLRRKFHGDQRGTEKRQRPAGELRSGLLQDRKGRPVAVERYGQPPAPQPRREPREGPGKERRQEGRQDRHEKRPSRFPRAHGRNRSPDRASGPRPRQPRGRK